MLDTVMTTLQITVILSFQNQRKILVTCVYHSSFKLPKSEKMVMSYMFVTQLIKFIFLTIMQMMS